MDDSQEILLNSLRNSGVHIPALVTAIRDLSSASLFSICSQSICLIDRKLSFPVSLPEDSMADRCKLCSDLASAFKHLGFVGDISFHEFLYPSEEDLYKLVRFLVGRLAVSECESSESFQVQQPLDENQTRAVAPEIKLLRLQTEAAELALANSKTATLGELNEAKSTFGNSESCENNEVEKIRADTRGLSLNKEEWRSGVVGQASIERVDGLGTTVVGKDKAEALGVDEYFCRHEQTSASLQQLSSKKNLLMDLIAKTSRSSHLLDKYELQKAKVAFDNQNSLDFYIQQLNDLIETRRDQLVKLDSHEWNALRLPLEEKRRNIEEALCEPEPHEKLQRKREIAKEIESILAEIRKREEEVLVFSAELQNQPKVASRESFVLRIKEITKNSRKQDTDVERILRETRDLQLESNAIQERLNRTYAVADETIFREARKDPVARQAYRLLTKIHEFFEQTAEKILSTDRTRREVADYEAKLATMATRSLNIDKLRADLDTIRKENDMIERERKNN